MRIAIVFLLIVAVSSIGRFNSSQWDGNNNNGIGISVNLPTSHNILDYHLSTH